MSRRGQKKIVVLAIVVAVIALATWGCGKPTYDYWIGLEDAGDTDDTDSESELDAGDGGGK